MPLAIALMFALVLVAARVAREANYRPRDHVLIFFGMLLFGALLYRLIDVLQHIEAPRWSSAVAGCALVGFLYASLRRGARRGQRQYTGPERRKRDRRRHGAPP
ncbi:hypothetical protein [Pseudoxanthomonas sp. USHLN014]|uniref:hypothetical protein n=1 Tax=Pseudoxanthomonas sp. USHLN014 TaxID=3081297 RepID=UPI00301CFA22